jgi:acetyltransferase-like isoleucine patch superfamily enzyme
MVLNIRDTGTRNKIQNASDETINGTIRFRGDRNKVVIADGCCAFNMNIDIGSNCLIDIEEKCMLSCIDIYCGDNAQVIIGEGSVFNYLSYLRCHEPSSIVIGSGFLCAANALITTSDMHSIYDIESGKRINPAKDISIGSSVWIGQDTYILKGSSIGSGAVIGAKAIVSGKIPKNVVAAGVPAKVIRENVYWKHELK